MISFPLTLFPMNHNSGVAPVVATLDGLKEVVSNLLLLLSDKEKEVIRRRFNLDNGRRDTLEDIGRDFSVTRERIRQIEKNALVKMRRNVFNTPLNALHDFVDDRVKKSGGLAREDVLVSELEALCMKPGVFDSSVAHLAFVLHDGIHCTGNTINFYPYVRGGQVSDHSVKYVSSQLVNQLHKHGDVRGVDKLHTDLEPKLKDVDFSVNTLKSLIDVDKRLTIVEDGLVGLMEWRHIHPRTLRDKILYVLRQHSTPMHFDAIAEKIKAAAFDNRTVNVQAVHNELIRHSQFILIGRGIYALAEWGYERGTVADVVRAILSEKGELSQDEIVDLVLEKRQVKRITILLALKNGAEFERVGRKRYRLKT